MASTVRNPILKRTASADQLYHNRHATLLQSQIGTIWTRKFQFHLPNELWGAASLALNLCSATKRKSLQKIAAVGPSIAASFNINTQDTKRETTHPSYPSSVTEALDYSPKLSSAEEALCFAFSTSICCLLYIITFPTSFSIIYASKITLLCAMIFSFSRYWLLEHRYYKKIAMTEKELAHKISIDPQFMTYKGIQLHYSRSFPNNNTSDNNNTMQNTHQNFHLNNNAMHCLHGFGACIYSWSFIQQHLSNRLETLITAHDMPGFGLSERSSSEHCYTLGFNGGAAKAVIEHALGNINGNTTENNINTTAPTSTTSSNKKKHWLMGHSMGAAACAEAVIQNPENIAGLILVAPAIVALWSGIPDKARGNAVATSMALVEEFVLAEDPINTFGEVPLQDMNKTGMNMNMMMKENNSFVSLMQLWLDIAHKTMRISASIIQSMVAEFARFFLFLFRPFFVLFLRKIVRSRSFWERGLSAAWSKKSKITKDYVDAYRVGMLIKGWESGILRFLSARFSEKSHFLDVLSSIFEDNGHLTQSERLAAVCTEHSLPVLIVHGVDDALVPLMNSRRLAKNIPGARLVEFQESGHMPHEEESEKFVDAVVDFVLLNSTHDDAKEKKWK